MYILSKGTAFIVINVDAGRACLDTLFDRGWTIERICWKVETIAFSLEIA